MMPQPNPHHVMELIRTFPSGAEVWHCPDCGREFAVQWFPYRKIVFDAGDEMATHTGPKGGLSVAAKARQDKQIVSDELRDALNEFMEGLSDDF